MTEKNQQLDDCYLAKSRTVHESQATKDELELVKLKITALLNDPWTEDQLVTVKAEIDTLFQTINERHSSTA